MWSDVVTHIDTVEEITTIAGLERLRPEWWALWHESRTATPFQTPSWIIAWWQRFGWDGLWVLALRSEDRLVGLAPLCIWNRQDISERTVLLIGTGITDYLDAVFAEDFENAGAAAVFEHLSRECERWDVCDFQQLSVSSMLLTRELGEGWSDVITEQDVCPVLVFPDGATDCTAFLPRKMRKNLRYYRRRAESAGEVRIEAASEANLDVLVDALFRLHTRRWERRGEAGMFADEDVQVFHRTLVRDLLQQDLLCMYGLYLDGTVVACYYGMFAKGQVYSYMSCFDPDLPELSLGTQIIGHAICDTARKDGVSFDFLRGQEDYKYLWGTTDHHTFRRRCRLNRSGRT